MSHFRKQLRPYQQDAVDKLKHSLKHNTGPYLITASVGAGKSLIIASVLRWLEDFGYRCLCLTLNSTLIQQNANAYKLQDGDCGIYCAGLNAKEHEKIIVFGSPHSVSNDIKNKNEISRSPFQLIIVDECHQISPHNHKSMYMRIFNHYRNLALEGQYSFRIVGLTGTPYRGKNESILGDNAFFKEEICNISTAWLVKNKYLSPPVFNKIDKQYDFSNLRVKATGQFDNKQLSSIVDSNTRLTHDIMQEVSSIVLSERFGAFIFASTIQHCHECSKSLPEGLWAIITGDTPHEERSRIIAGANQGTIKFLINVNCLTVGVDIPAFDVCAWLRPTESLILFTQGIGRVLRLSPGKTMGLILDYAGNLNRHGDIDDPIINEALQPRDSGDKDFCIPCPACGCANTLMARRCIGILSSGRCDYYFSFKDCQFCSTKNDTTARHCRECKKELIDPNKRLHKIKEQPLWQIEVTTVKSKIMTIGARIEAFSVVYNNAYRIWYTLRSQKTINMFYGDFLKASCPNSYEIYWALKNKSIRCLSLLEELQTTMQSPRFIYVDRAARVIKRVY